MHRAPRFHTHYLVWFIVSIVTQGMKNISYIIKMPIDNSKNNNSCLSMSLHLITSIHSILFFDGEPEKLPTITNTNWPEKSDQGRPNGVWCFRTLMSHPKNNVSLLAMCLHLITSIHSLFWLICLPYGTQDMKKQQLCPDKNDQSRSTGVWPFHVFIGCPEKMFEALECVFVWFLPCFYCFGSYVSNCRNYLKNSSHGLKSVIKEDPIIFDQPYTQ